LLLARFDFTAARFALFAIMLGVGIGARTAFVRAAIIRKLARKERIRRLLFSALSARLLLNRV
jgi:hypothetical protein